MNTHKNEVPKMDLFNQVIRQMCASFALEPSKVREAAGKAVKSVTDYLKKGERLMSLAKDAYDRSLEEVSITDIEQKILSSDKLGDDYYSVREVCAKVFRKTLSGVRTDSIAEDENIQKVYDLFGDAFDFIISKPVSGYSARSLGSSFAERTLLSLTVFEDIDGNKHSLQVESIAGRKSSASVCRMWVAKNRVFIYDMAYILADMYILKVCRDAFKDIGKEGTVMAERFGWFKDGIYADFFGGPCDKYAIFNPPTISGRPYYSEADIHRLENWIGHRELWVYECLQRNVPEDKLEGCRIISPSDFEDMEKLERIKTSGLTLLGLLHDRRRSKEASVDFQYRYDGDYAGTEAITHSPVLNFPSAIRVFLADIFFTAADIRKTELKTREYFSEQFGKKHAKAYQTKKNIPEKTVKAMEGSAFNDYFGYVEFDETVDLVKVDEIYREFGAVMDSFLPDVRMEDNSLRFRLIGNHKATGLYYPTVKCMVVDVRYPSSFMHELGHLLDYKYGQLSHGGRFYEIRKLYETEVDKAMKKDSGNKEKWEGRGKYNRAYYLEPTEIFARSFEIYMYKHKGVENSLLKLPEGYERFCYPSGDSYLDAVRGYFDVLFDTVFSVKEKEGEAA